MTTIDWHEIRPWEGSQHKGFEELCAQLAAAEPQPQGSVFERKGAPDAGVECYRRFTNGDEVGWQAKYFPHTMGATQWRDLDDSVATALEKHPRLVEYTICIPLDLPDARKKKVISAREQWCRHVAKWAGWVATRGMSVTFTYWGSHELYTRLLSDEHRGRVLYWFNKQLFSKQWFDQRLEETIANADQRYIPALNIDLPIEHLFHGLGRTTEFYDALLVCQGKIRRAHDHASRSRLAAIDATATANLANAVRSLLPLLNQHHLQMQALPFAEIQESADRVAQYAMELNSRVLEAERNTSASRVPGALLPRESLGIERHYLWELCREAQGLAEFVTSPQAILANMPSLVLVGSAGMGKTHLLCHSARVRAAQDRPTILILSEQLANAEPWSEILRALQLSCTAEEFLGALNAAGQARGCRSILAIDALNEGDARVMWRRALPGFLTQLARYPWVGVVASVRSSYEESIVSQSLVNTALVRVEHRGFCGVEARAATHFFSHYGIVAPTIPPLHPEFSNPLFLRLFCQALRNFGYRELPPGLRGLTHVFTFFLDSVNTKLSRPEFLDADPAARIVQSCVEHLAEAMAAAQQGWLPRAQAGTIISGFDSGRGYAQSLFRLLVVEGVLAEDRFHTASDARVDGVRFTYEKFSDHLVAAQLLRRHLDLGAPASSFVRGTPLGDLLRDENAWWRFKGLVEAFAIQLPESVGRELPELVPEAAGWTAVREAMIESIIWRDPAAFTAATRAYLNEWLLPYDDTFGLTLSAFLTTATQVDHPYNAQALHRNLSRRSVGERDAWWSIYLHHEYTNNGTNVITRLLDWCEVGDGKSDLTDDSILLAGVTVTWFFTSSNRFLRDRATKALVRLMGPRLRLLGALIREFSGVDDPYVLERLMAAAYGCVLRSQDTDGIHAVAHATYEVFFADEPPVHLLLRDYARGVVERAVHLRADPAFDRARIAPPYRSEWPNHIPTEEDLKQRGYGRDGVDYAQRRICSSVIGDDFARYIIGTNSWSFEWANRRLHEPPPLSREEQTRNFVASLTSEQRRAWQRFRRVFRAERSRRSTEFVLQFIDQQGIVTGRVGRPAVPCDQTGPATERFVALLSAEQQTTFTSVVLPFLERGDGHFGEEDRFDLRLLQGYILPRVFELGWTAERFGVFDREMRDIGRESHKAERLGKKYQWIAYYEVLARVADNFVFKENSWSERPVPFVGPWQVTGLRDIDPSMLVREVADDSRRLPTRSWWAPQPYGMWYAQPSHSQWVQSRHDLMDVGSSLSVADLLMVHAG